MKRGIKATRAGAVLVLIGAASVTVAAGIAAAAESFRKPSGAEIGSQIIGKQITDDVHWFETYKTDGTILSVSMGVERKGHWEIEQDQLCLREVECAGWYEIWVNGDEVQFRIDGKEVMTLTGVLRAP